MRIFWYNRGNIFRTTFILIENEEACFLQHAWAILHTIFRMTILKLVLKNWDEVREHHLLLLHITMKTEKIGKSAVKN